MKLVVQKVKPEKIEKELLEEYESKYKVLPIANWRQWVFIIR